MANKNSPSVPVTELRTLVGDMRQNAEGREVSETQDMLAALEEHWAGEIEQMIEQHE